MSAHEVQSEIIEFIESSVLKSADDKVEADTPLLEWGILDSISTAKLIAFIREHFGVYVPPHQIVGAHFQTVQAIAGLVVDLQIEPSAQVRAV